jgi:hypothetical protein
VLDEWGLTVDAWEALPWWQQDAYLRAHNRRHKAREAAQKKQQPRSARGGRSQAARPAAGSQGPSAGSGKKLRDTPMWQQRGQRPAAGTTRPSPATGR